MATEGKGEPARAADRARAECTRGLREWFATPVGAALLDAERALLDAILPNLFGYYLLQIGALARAETVSASRIRGRVCVFEAPPAQTADCAGVYGSAQALPMATDSVDVVLLQHVLEFQPSAHETLREVERVLVPEGHVIVVALNPLSLLGLWRMLARRRGGLPWSGRFFGLTRLKDWMALLGFDTLEVRTAFFRPPFSKPALLDRARVLETLGARLWPYAGGAYVLVARKRVATLTPVKPRWRPHRGVVGIRLAEPTASGCSPPRAAARVPRS
jgi:SAM-dependent methyltransferase